jgi:hypothetical protein
MDEDQDFSSCRQQGQPNVPGVLSLVLSSLGLCFSLLP